MIGEELCASHGAAARDVEVDVASGGARVHVHKRMIRHEQMVNQATA